MEIVPKVTLHAELRWLERVHGVDVKALAGSGRCDGDILRLAMESLGIKREDIFHEILTPAIKARIVLGETRIKHRGLDLIISETGYVVSAMDRQDLTSNVYHQKKMSKLERKRRRLKRKSDMRDKVHGLKCGKRG